MRATLRLSSPAWFAQPSTTSSIAAGSAPARRTTSAITSAARSSGRTSASAPRCRPTGVRTASTTNASRRDAAIPAIVLEGCPGRRPPGSSSRPPRASARTWPSASTSAASRGGRLFADVMGRQHAAHEPHRAAQQRRAGRDRAIALARHLIEAARVRDAADRRAGDAARHDGGVDQKHALPGGTVFFLIRQVRAEQAGGQAHVQAR